MLREYAALGDGRRFDACRGAVFATRAGVSAIDERLKARYQMMFAIAN